MCADPEPSSVAWDWILCNMPYISNASCNHKDGNGNCVNAVKPLRDNSICEHPETMQEQEGSTHSTCELPETVSRILVF